GWPERRDPDFPASVSQVEKAAGPLASPEERTVDGCYQTRAPHEAMIYSNREQWQAALERAAQALLARCAAGVNPLLYRLSTGPCTRHGPVCACVIYGAILRHVRWRQTDPERLAAELLPDPGMVGCQRSRS